MTENPVIFLGKWAQCDWVLDNGQERHSGKQGQVQALPLKAGISMGDFSIHELRNEKWRWWSFSPRGGCLRASGSG